MNGLPPPPADRPLPDRERRRQEFVSLIRMEQELGSPFPPLVPVPPPDDADLPLDEIEADGTLRGAVGPATRPAARRTARGGWPAVAAVAASVLLIGSVAAALALRGSTGIGAPDAHPAAEPPPVSGPVLNGVPVATAQRELTACLQAAVSGKLTSGDYTSPLSPADPVDSYRVVIAEPHLYRALENGLSTWIVGKGPSGQLAGCSVPQDAANPNGREALLGTRPSGALSNELTVEYSTGGVGSPALDGTRASVYANTLVGRYGDEISRVTVQYPGGREHNAETADGIWFDQSLLGNAGAGGDAAVVRGYGARGELLFSFTQSTPPGGP